MAASDIFPLIPSYPITRKKLDRKIRQRMESGKLYIRSKGTDPWQFDLVGIGSPDDVLTLEQFYELMAKDIFTFQDKSFTPEIDRVVAFGGTIEADETDNIYMIWKCTLIETTLA
jgi:hypothetical protein